MKFESVGRSLRAADFAAAVHPAVLRAAMLGLGFLISVSAARAAPSVEPEGLGGMRVPALELLREAKSAWK